MSSVEEKQRLLVEMVMRQTNYTYEEVETRLVKYNNNYMQVIREALGTQTSSTDNVTSINQGIYKEIRGLMDTAATTYRRKKEFEEKKEQLLDYLKTQKEEQDKQKRASLQEIPEETSDKAKEDSPNE
jgi:hypothetical protein